MDKSSLQWRWIIYVVYLPFDTKDCSMEIKKTALTRNSFLFAGITQITQSLCPALHAPTLYRSIMMSFRMSLMVKLEALPSPHTHTLSNMAIPMNECFFPGIHPSVIKDDCCKVARGRILSGNSNVRLWLDRRSDYCCSAEVITCSSATMILLQNENQMVIVDIDVLLLEFLCHSHAHLFSLAMFVWMHPFWI